MSELKSGISNPESAICIDQLGKSIHLPQAPLRIVSLVPSQTELLFDLGLDREVLGITKFCVHPDSWFRNKTRVGGTKKLNIELIRSLQPNLVIANKEENTIEDVIAIEAFCPVWTSDISNIPEAFEMISSIGALTGTFDKAKDLVNGIKNALVSIDKGPGYRCAYMIWKDPWMVAGGGTFINDMVNACGLINVYGDQTRYPTIELSDLVNNGIQILLLSSEPFPFKMNDLEALSNILPGVKIKIVDGEIFSWYGSRMLSAAKYFKTMLKDF